MNKKLAVFLALAMTISSLTPAVGVYGADCSEDVCVIGEEEAEDVELFDEEVDEEAGEEGQGEGSGDDTADAEDTSKTDISVCDIQVAEFVICTGEKLTPEVIVSNEGATLEAQRDYILEYKNNKKPGTASVTVTGTGMYEGTVSKEFEIKLAKPRLVSILSRSYNSLKLSWEKVPGATGYYVYRKSGGSWVKVGTTSKTTLAVGSAKYPVKTGVKYQYTVAAYHQSGSVTKAGDYDTVGIEGRAVPNKPVLVKAESVAENKIELHWKKAAGATNYLIYRKNSQGRWKLLKNVKGANVTSYTHKSSAKFPIKKGKKYVYTVRSYTTANKTKGLYDAKGMKVKALSKVEITNAEALKNAQAVVEKVTNKRMTKSQKLQTCFNWVMAKPYVTRRTFTNFEGWPAVYANDHFLLGGGNCHSDAAAFAYLAKALGYKNVYVCSDASDTSAHSWAEVDGLVYDPLFAQSKGYSRYYGVTYRVYELSTVLHIKI